MKIFIMVHSGWVANQSKHGEVGASSFPCEYLVKTLMSSQNSGFSALPKDKPLNSRNWFIWW